MNAELAMEWVARGCGILALIQAAEFLALRAAWADRGVWAWPRLRTELKGPSILLSENGFLGLNLLRGVLGVALIVLPVHGVALGLLVIHLLTLWRWRGSFNGASDSMNFILLIAATLTLSFEQVPDAARVCCWFVTFHLLLSYYRSGYFKLKSSAWRSGLALKAFLQSPRYQPLPPLERLLGVRILATGLSWGAMLFEIGFPLALLGTKWAVPFMVLGALFHLFNIYALGLNRFFFAWLAAYPALYYCAQ